MAWKEVSPVPALSANPSHLPFLSGLALGGISTFDPFAKPPGSTETKAGLEGAQALPSGKPSSPVGKQEAGMTRLRGTRGLPRAGLCPLPPAERAAPLPTVCIPELDLFGDPIPSSKQNGTKEPDAFDLGVVGEALAQPSKEARARTPESFLGPSASSLVNLDSLVKTPQAAKTRNPFLTGSTAPSLRASFQSPALALGPHSSSSFLKP